MTPAEPTPELRSFGPARLPLEVGGTTAMFELTLWHVGPDRWIVASLDPSHVASPLVRIESACAFGHVFASAQCDCAYQWQRALAQIATAGHGLLLYGVDHDGRGLGLEAHFEIYRLRQQEGLDTDEVYRHLDAPVDARDYGAVAVLLRLLRVTRFTLLTNNEHRIEFFREQGFDVEVQPLVAPLTVHNMSTLMIEHEDLRYEWSFRTHSEHLVPLQDLVAEHHDRRALLVVDGDQIPVHRSVDEGSWHLVPPEPGSLQGLCVAYLTDLPRVDEVVALARAGASVVVIPVKIIPAWLRRMGDALGLKVVDWARGNAYATPRAQWEPQRWNERAVLYQRDNQRRLVERDGVPGESRAVRWRDVDPAEGDDAALGLSMDLHRLEGWAIIGS